MKNREIAAVLAKEGLLPRERAERAAEEAALSGFRLDTLCLLRSWVPEGALLDAVGTVFRSRTADHGALREIPARLLSLIPARAAERFRVVPFHLEGKTLSVAALDPTDLLVEDELRLLTGCVIRSHAALEVRIHEALASAYGVPLPPVIERWLAGGGRTQHTPAAPQPTVEPVRRRPERPHSPAAPAAGRSPRAAPPSDLPEALELSSDELGEFPGLARLAAARDEEPEAPAAAPPAEETATPEAPAPAPAAAPVRRMDDPELDPEERLVLASEALGSAEMRDDIADALLAYCRPHFRRRALFILRRESIVGWRGEGEGVDETTLRAVAIPTGEPSVFQPLLHGTAFWLGPLASMPRNLELSLGLGGEPSGGCTVFPVHLRGRVVCFLWGDNLEEGLRGVPVPQLRRLTAKAGLAFEAYLLRAKIRAI